MDAIFPVSSARAARELAFESLSQECREVEFTSYCIILLVLYYISR